MGAGLVGRDAYPDLFVLCACGEILPVWTKTYTPDIQVPRLACCFVDQNAEAGHQITMLG